MSFNLAIVSPTDTPLYELALQTSRQINLPSSSNSSASASTSSFPSWSTFTGSNGSDLGPPTPEGKAIGGNLGLVAGKGGQMGERHLMQMIVHKSLDSLEEVMETTGSLYFKAIDKHNEWTVSAFVAGNVKFVLLHDTKNDDGIRQFFLDTWDLYVKIMLSPFMTVNTPIRNPFFEAKIRASAKRNL